MTRVTRLNVPDAAHIVAMISLNCVVLFARWYSSLEIVARTGFARSASQMLCTAPTLSANQRANLSI
jgi:hypothetical protein